MIAPSAGAGRAVLALVLDPRGERTAIRETAGAARQQCEVGTQTPVDPTAPIALPVGTTSTVSDLLRTLLVG